MFSFNLSLRFSSNKKRHGSACRVERFILEAGNTIRLLDAEKRPATIKNYVTALRSFKTFIQERGDAGLTADLLLQYESWLKAEGKCRNTSSCYLRSLRTLYNNIYGESDGLFHEVFTRNAKTAKRAMPTASVQQLASVRPEVPACYRLTYDIFLFSVYAFGMPFIDLAYLNEDNISGDAIVYRRHKTHQLITVPLLPEMAECIERYRGKTHDGLLFPVLPSRECSYRTYQSSLTKYNRHLKQLSRLIDCPMRLTSYVARHTWATLASKSGVNVHHISQAMGHTNIRTTEIYLAQLSPDELRDDSLAITHLIHRG